MNYEEMAKKAMEAGKATEVSEMPVKFENEGDSMTGVLIKKVLHHFEETDSDCFRYTFKTDNGNKSCILGALADQNANMTEGNIYHVIYRGKIQLSPSKSAKTFSIYDLGKDK